MTVQRLLALALSGSLSCLAMGAHASGEPYVGLGAHYFHPDSARNADDGAGGSLILGLPFSSNPNLSLEFQANGSYVDGAPRGAFYRQAGAGLDLRALLSANRYFTPFVVGGGGITQTNLSSDDHQDGYINLGLGALLPVISSAFAVRTEARAVGTFDSETTTKRFLTDYRVSVGLEYRFNFGADTDAASAPVDTAVPVSEQETVIAETDSDQDSVPDSLDECPDSAPGVKVDAKGCLFVPPPPPDSDQDGVLNDRDLCPGTPAGVAVDATGCPLDADGDSVNNDKDLCPDTAKGLKVDNTGCVVNQTLVLNTILFASGSADLLDESKTILDGIAGSLQGQPSTRVVIIGHTDALGTQASNLTLSQQRAETVRGYLISRGIDGGRLESEGYGEFNPVASDETEEGRAKNRRVEFRIATQP